jgi:hypothetical protein
MRARAQGHMRCFAGRLEAQVIPTRLLRPVFFAALGLGACVTSACTKEIVEEVPDENGGNSDTTNASPDLSVIPAVAYSGFDGQHVFRAPFAVYGAPADAQLVASDPSKVKIERTKLANPQGDVGSYFMVTTLAAGEVKLSVTSGGKSASANLAITSYPSTRFKTGETRYLQGGTTDPACTKCHAGQSGIDHSPAALASAADGDVARIVRTGLTVSGRPIQTEKEHQWTVTDAELDGLVTYLRALDPRGFGAK